MWWEEGKPSIGYLLRLYGESDAPVDRPIEQIALLKRYRGPRALTPDDLPDLVTFADVMQPKSVLAVDPHNLPAVLGRDVKWRNITIEVTDEAVTRTIEQRLPWLKDLKTGLDGSQIRYLDERATLANSLNASAFKRGM